MMEYHIKHQTALMWMYFALRPLHLRSFKNIDHFSSTAEQVIRQSIETFRQHNGTFDIIMYPEDTDATAYVAKYDDPNKNNVFVGMPAMYWAQNKLPLDAPTSELLSREFDPYRIDNEYFIGPLITCPQMGVTRPVFTHCDDHCAVMTHNLQVILDGRRHVLSFEIPHDDHFLNVSLHAGDVVAHGVVPGVGFDMYNWVCDAAKIIPAYLSNVQTMVEFLNHVDTPSRLLRIDQVIQRSLKFTVEMFSDTDADVVRHNDESDELLPVTANLQTSPGSSYACIRTDANDLVWVVDLSMNRIRAYQNTEHGAWVRPYTIKIDLVKDTLSTDTFHRVVDPSSKPGFYRIDVVDTHDRIQSHVSLASDVEDIQEKI